MDYEFKEIEERFKTLPKEVQLVLSSPSTASTMKEIADKHGLLIDQESILFDITSYILLGLLPSKDFVKTLSREAGVDEDTAISVGEDVNHEVFDKIKSSMQSVQSAQEMVPEKNEDLSTLSPHPSLSALEQVGGFTVEKEANPDEDGHNIEQKSDILESIENPAPSAEVTTPKTKIVEEGHTDLLVDHLLTTPITTTEQKIVIENPVTPPPAPKKTGPDPYHEPIQ